MPEKIEIVQEEEIVAEPVKEEPAEETSGTYSADDVEAAQAYLAKLLADAEAEAAAEQEAEKTVEPVEETPVETESPKPATFSKSFDLDMLSALTKELEAKTNANGKMSDEEFLEKWKK